MEDFLLYASYCLYIIIGISTILFFCFYGRRMSWWNGSKKPQKRLVNPQKTHFAIIVPARNEAKAIGELIESIKKQTYDKAYFDTVIVVKEEEDPTIEMVKEINAITYVDKEQNNKGHALNYALKALLKEYPNKYDAFVFIDADCVLDDYYLEEMNNAMASGADVINSRLIVKNYLIKGHKGNTWASRCNGLIWPMLNEMGNRKKSDLGITLFTLGTGLVIRNNLIESWGGWPFCQTMTEDGELARECALYGYKTFYYEYALCYVEEARSLHITNIRRQRWMEGVIHCDRLYNKRIKKMNTKQSFLDWYSFHNLYYTYAYFGTLFVVSVISVVFWIMSLVNGYNMISPLALGSLFTSVLITYFFYMFLALYATLAGGKYIKTHRINKFIIVITYPFYHMWYIKVMAKALFWRKSKKWKVIKRVDFNRGKRREVVSHNDKEV